MCNSLDLHLDILGLLPHGDLGEAGEVHHGEAQHVGRVELEADSLGTDALVASRHSIRLGLDLLPDLVPVGVYLVLGVQELRPLLLVNCSPFRASVNPVILKKIMTGSVNLCGSSKFKVFDPLFVESIFVLINYLRSVNEL